MAGGIVRLTVAGLTVTRVASVSIPVAGMTVAVGGTGMSMTAGVAVPVPITTVTVTVTVADTLERHGREADDTQKEQECVQIHLSTEAVVGQRALQQCAADRLAATSAGLCCSPPATSSAGGQPDQDRRTGTSRCLLQRGRPRTPEPRLWGRSGRFCPS